MSRHEHKPTEAEAAAMFEPPSWEERYSGEHKMWSGNPNPQLVSKASSLGGVHRGARARGCRGGSCTGTPTQPRRNDVGPALG